jgi:hypothetical protein
MLQEMLNKKTSPCERGPNQLNEKQLNFSILYYPTSMPISFKFRIAFLGL